MAPVTSNFSLVSGLYMGRDVWLGDDVITGDSYVVVQLAANSRPSHFHVCRSSCEVPITVVQF
jgi:hypothetical protein